MRLLGILTLLLIATAGVHAQGSSTSPAQPEVVPAVKTEDQVRILSLQVSQYRKLLEMRQLEARYKALQEAISNDQQQLELAVRDAAKNAGADLEKFRFDLDDLRFVPQPLPPKSPEVKRP
jgi:hypothetical protein